MITFGQFILPLAVLVALALLFFSIKLFFYSPTEICTEDIAEQEDRQITQIIRKRTEKRIAVQEETFKKPETPAVKTETNPEKNRIQEESGHVSIAFARPVKSASKAVPAERTAVKKTIETAQPESRIKKTENTGTKNKPAEQKKSVKTVAKEQPVSKTEQKKTAVKTEQKAAVKQEQKAVVNTQQKAVQKKETETALKPVQKTEPKTDKKETKGASKRYDVQIGVFSDKKNAEQHVQTLKKQGYAAYAAEETINSALCCKVRVKGSADRGETKKLSDELKSKGYEVYTVEIQ